MRVLVLGNDYNPISIAVADALAGHPAWTLVVGVHDPAGAGPLRVVRRAQREHGVAFVARRVVDLAWSRARVLLRRAGVPLRGARSLRELSIARRLGTVSCDHINAAGAIARLRSIAPDLIIVAGFSQILRAPVLDVPPLGCINVHPSMLPRYRGPNPLYWVLRQGETATGVTVHVVDTGIDTGGILAQETLDIRPGETERTLRARSAAVAARLAVRVAEQFAAGVVPEARPQDERLASYHPLPPRGASRL